MKWICYRQFTDNFKQGCIVLGEREIFEDAYKKLNEVDVPIEFFCELLDKDSGNLVEGKTEIISLEFFLENCKEKPVFIYENNKYLKMTEMLRSHGFTKLMSLQRFLGVVAEENEISEAFSLLEDDRSKQIYKSLVNAKVTLDTKYVQEAYCGYERYYQYFDEEVIQFTENEVFVDGGGLDGNTSLTFVAKTKNKFKKIYIFEPNKDSYDVASQLPKFLNDDRIQVFEKGLLDSYETISFNVVSEAGGCHIDFNGESTCTIETVPLDQFIDDEVTFIKFDIEGSEERALFGAENIIKKYSPKLAICLYHKFDDLWKLPILIYKLNPNYKLYIRHYTNELNKWLDTPLLETVCYAIPK